MHKVLTKKICEDNATSPSTTPAAERSTDNGRDVERIMEARPRANNHNQADGPYAFSSGAPTKGEFFNNNNNNKTQPFVVNSSQSNGRNNNDDNTTTSNQIVDTTESEQQRWTKEEYQALIDQVLQRYASTLDAEQGQFNGSDTSHGLYGGSNSDVHLDAAADDVNRWALELELLDYHRNNKSCTTPAARPLSRSLSQPLLLPSAAAATAPQKDDIRLGRGQHSNNKHAGNQNWRSTVCHEQRRMYNLAIRPDDPTEMTKRMGHGVATQTGGHFVQLDERQSIGMDVRDARARFKLARMMRGRRSHSV